MTDRDEDVNLIPNNGEEDDDFLSLSLACWPQKSPRSAPETSSPLPGEQQLVPPPPPSGGQFLVHPPPPPQVAAPYRPLHCPGTLGNLISQTDSKNPILCCYSTVEVGTSSLNESPPLNNGPERRHHVDVVHDQPECQIRSPPPRPGPLLPSPPRRNAEKAPCQGTSDSTIPPLYPWVTDHCATVHTLKYLQSQGIHTITGEVQCKRCERRFEIGYDLEKEFLRIGTFFLKNMAMMHDRAPEEWMQPQLRNCEHCGEQKCVKPVIAENEKEINWLFLFLGEMIGCCTLEQLKYLLKHNNQHRTAAKNRVVYLAYDEICWQLDPSNGLFGRRKNGRS